MKNLRRYQCVLALAAGLGLTAFWALNALSTLRPSGTWTSTASLSQARAGAAAALLDSGDILVTGGQSATTILSSVERYGSGGVFSGAPAMTYPRRGHTITKLDDGRLLVAGGITTGGAPTATAEVYSVVTGSWSTAGGMSTARSGHTATLLSDGRVLIAGGSNGATATATLEVFNPVSNTFSVLPATMSSPRTGHGAATLWSGAVLLVGGSNGAAALQTAEIFDPETNSVTATGSLSAPRASLAASALIDGKVLAAGGSNEGGELGSAEIYDPATGTFSPTGAMAAPRSGHAAFLLPQNGGVLIYGGSAPSTTVEIYQRWTGTFVATGSLSEARAQAAGSALVAGEGRLLLAGGSGPLGTSELYNFATVITDKDDYAPGEVVTISGSGWQPGETVTMVLKEFPKTCTDRTLSAVADPSGVITNNEFVPEEHHLGVRFFLTASGGHSGQKAHITFTDDRVILNGNPTIQSGQSPNPVAPAATANYTVRQSFNNPSSSGDDTCTVQLGTETGPGQNGLPIGSTVVFTPATLTVTSAGNQDFGMAITPPAGTMNGTFAFRVVVSGTAGDCSGDSGRVNTSLVVQAAANTAPTADAKSVSVLEDAVNASIGLSGSDPDSPSLTFAIVSGPSSGTLGPITSPICTSSGGGTSCTASVPYTPTANYFGSDSFTYRVNDGTANSTAATVNITVTPVNDEPSFTSGGNVTVNEDSGAYSAAWATSISVGPPNESGQTPSFTVTNGNNALFSVQPAVAPNGTLTFTPAPNAHGSAIVSVTLKDNGGTADGGDDTSPTIDFTITVNSVNDEPSFTGGGNVTVNEDSGAYSAAWATAISVGPPNESGQTPSFTVTNDNSALFSVQPAVASNGTLTFTPAPDAFGSGIVSVTLMDDGGTANGGDDTSPTINFTITVNSVNDEPSFTSGGNVTVDEDSGPYSAGWATAISVGPANESGQTPTFTVTNGNNSLFSVHPAVASDGTLTFTPAPDANGSATVNVTLKDDGGTANGGDDTSPTIMFTIFVTAVNDPPSIAFTLAPNSANEGETKTYNFSITDPDVGDTFVFGAGFPSCGSGGNLVAASQSINSVAKTGTFQCKFPDGPATPAVGVKIEDAASAPSNLIEVTVTVANVDPVVTPAGNQTVNEGASHSFSLGSFTDPGVDGPWEVTVDWGDGSSDTTFNMAAPGALSAQLHTYADGPNDYTVTVSVAETGGAPFDSGTFMVHVDNVVPTVTLNALPAIDEGGSVSASATFSDPGGANDAPYTCTVNYGDGSGDLAGTVSNGGAGPACTGPSHTYVDNVGSPFTVTIKVKDNDAGEGTGTGSQTVNNVAPIVSAPSVSPEPSDEGSSAVASATFTDPGINDAPFMCAVNYGDGSPDVAGSISGNTCTGPSHTYADNGTFSVTVKVTDKDGSTGTQSSNHIVKNVDPSVGTPMVSPTPSNEGSSVTASASFTDPGTLDTFTCTVDYGDGTLPQAGMVTGTTCNGPAHTYADDGNFTVTVKVTDDDGGMGSNTTSHTVNNIAPVVTGPGNQTADEGTAKSFTLGSFTDPGADSPWKVVVNWGDGSTDSMFTVAAAGSLGSQNHTFADDGNYTVTVTVTEDNGAGASDSETFNVVVANINPVVTAPANQTADEGTSKAFSLGSFTDPGDDDPWAVTVSWGDSSPNTTFSAASTGSLGTQNHTYADNGTYTVTVTVREDNGTGASDSATFEVVVANVAPIVILNGATTANEGQTKNYTFTVSDPGADTYSVTAGFPTCGTGGTVVAGSFNVTGNTGSQTGGFSCSFPDGPASPTVQVKFTDDDGGTSTNGSISVAVSNVDPTATFPMSATVNEGSSATFNFSAQSDPSTPDTSAGFKYAYSCDGSALGSTPYSTASPSASVTCSFPNGPLIVPVRARIIDKDNGYTEYTASVTVLNMPPVITDLLGLPSGPVQKNTTPLLVNLTANFTDPGTLDTHTCTINWDNGAGPVNGTVTEAAGSGTCTGSNNVNIASPGVYTITVVVTDNSGASATRIDFIVVYDPDGGFVTGGGWIQSPAGAYKPDMTLGGKANFGFVSKYKKGQSAPDGETQFQLHFANFTFHSTAYDWLVVAGAKAQYKGVGRLNGMFGSNNTSGYGFLLTATDGDATGGGGADKFRIKIWDKATGDTVVYDNVTAPDDIDSANPQVIGGGSIVIHSGGNGKK